ncbi:hypothetical protein Tco_1370860 [Tanacetum coccineum]
MHHHTPIFFHTTKMLYQHKGKEIAKPVTPQSESVSEEDSDPEQARRDKDMKKNLALLAKAVWESKDDEQFAGARETVGSPVVQNWNTMPLNCKGLDTMPGKCRKPKRFKDYAYTRKDTDEEIDEQELNTYYSFMAKIQEYHLKNPCSTGQPLEQYKTMIKMMCLPMRDYILSKPESINDTYVLEKMNSNDQVLIPSNIFTNDNQTKQTELEKYTALNDLTSDYKILQTKLNETLGLIARKDIDIKEEKADFSNIYDLLLEECVSKDVTCSYLHSLSDLNANTELQCLYLHKVKECECLAQKLSKQTESVNKEVHNKLLKSFAKLENHSISLELALQQCKEQMKNNSVYKENRSNVFRKEREQYHEIHDMKAQMQDKNIVSLNYIKSNKNVISLRKSN